MKRLISLALTSKEEEKKVVEIKCLLIGSDMIDEITKSDQVRRRR